MKHPSLSHIMITEKKVETLIKDSRFSQNMTTYFCVFLVFLVGATQQTLQKGMIKMFNSQKYIHIKWLHKKIAPLKNENWSFYYII